MIQMRNSLNTSGLLDLINSLPRGLVMAEVGCYAGESTKMFLDSKKIDMMYAIDIWDDVLSVYENIENNHDFNLVEERFDENVKGFNVTKLKMTFEKASDLLPKLDVIYIDANHDYEYVKKDIKVSIEKIKPNGIICGHDYNTETPGVIEAVNEFFGKPDVVFSDSSWLVYLK